MIKKILAAITFTFVAAMPLAVQAEGCPTERSLTAFDAQPDPTGEKTYAFDGTEGAKFVVIVAGLAGVMPPDIDLGAVRVLIVNDKPMSGLVLFNEDMCGISAVQLPTPLLQKALDLYKGQGI